MKISAKKMEKWLTLNARRLELEREARAVEKEKDLLSTEFKAALDAEGKDSITRGKFRVGLVAGRPSVSWKDELVGRLGAELANSIVQRAPVPRKIQVEDLRAA